MRPSLRHRLAAALFALAAGTAAAADPAQVVRDPYYGDTLFHFYQGRYFSAVTGLMASQHFNRVAQHADEAEVLRGGMLLSYGLHREAGQIFARLIDNGAKPAVRDRAWYFLARIRYQRGFFADAEEALARIEGSLPAELEEERGLLHANLLLARADAAGAASVLGALVGMQGRGSVVARFNLGVALIRSGDAERGNKLLDEIGRAPAADEEARSLRDRANVALGFAALQGNKPEAARAALERVRLAGLHSNKALLGFGWAAAALEQPAKALVPWTELVGRDTSDAAVLEARIAVPYAYAELGAYGQSLAGYTEAIAAFDREHQTLNESIAAIRTGKLVDGLLERNPGEEMGWFWNIRDLPAMPHAGHLAPVLAQHEFQEAFKNWRDLRFLERNLADWRDRLGVFGDMLGNRRDGYAQRLPQVLAQARDISLAPLAQRREALAAELARAHTAADGAAFADPKERDLLARIASVRAAVAQLGVGPAADAAREKLRLAAGALTWQLAQAHPTRMWDARKALRAVDAGLSEARARTEALARGQHDEPARQQQFAGRIAELERRIGGLIPVVAALGREQQGQVQDIAVAELERQQERLAVYATQARFAVAQLYDRATVTKSEAPDASRP